MFTTEMTQLFAVVLGRDSQQVTEAVLREGGMQFINISELEGGQPDKVTHTPAVIITKDNVDQYYDPEALF